MNENEEKDFVEGILRKDQIEKPSKVKDFSQIDDMYLDDIDNQMNKIKEGTKSFIRQKNIKSNISKLVKVIRISNLCKCPNKKDEDSKMSLERRCPTDCICQLSDSRLYTFPADIKNNISHTDLSNQVAYSQKDEVTQNLPVFIIVEDILNTAANQGFKIWNDKQKSSIHQLQWFEAQQLCMNCKLVISDMTFTESRVEIITHTMVRQDLTKNPTNPDIRLYTLFKSKVYQIYSRLKDLNQFLSLKRLMTDKQTIEQAITLIVGEKLVFQAWNNYQDWVNEKQHRQIFYVFTNGRIAAFNSLGVDHKEEKRIRLVLGDSNGIQFYSCIGQLTNTFESEPKLKYE